METVERHISRISDRWISLSGFVQAATNLLVLSLWLWLYRSAFTYLGILFSREEFRTNQIALAGVLALILLKARDAYRRGRESVPDEIAPHPNTRRSSKKRFAQIQAGVLSALTAEPRLHLPALGFALGGSLLYLLVERFLDINTLSASLFGLASYGLLGLWMAPRRWRAGIPAVLLLIGVLPFGEHLETFAGYPLRILTAELVRDGLAAAGFHSVGVDTILIFENGISQVDLPCSGVKSLWTGMLFLLAAGWIERSRLDRRWLLPAVALVFLLFISNLVRVAVLVAVGQVAGWPLAAELLHLPLGVLGFSAACAVAALLLRSRPAEVSSLRAGAGYPVRTAPGWFGAVMAASILVLILAYSPRPQAKAAPLAQDWSFPTGLATEPMPLSPKEVEWLARGGVDSVQRHRFTWQGTSGSMILITSRTWRAHHRPERCFEVYGLQVENWRTVLVSDGFPIRSLSLNYGEGQGSLSAAYWFQSVNRTTDDYSTRMWADLDPQRERWVLVTLLFDQAQDTQLAQVQELYQALHKTVKANLEGGAP